MVGNQFIPVSIRETSNDKKRNIMIFLAARFEVINKLYSTISPLFRIDFVIFIKRERDEKREKIEKFFGLFKE